MSSPQLLNILSIALDIGKFLAEAIINGDEQTWRPIVDLLPAPLKSRVERIAQDVKTQEELEEILKKN